MGPRPRLVQGLEERAAPALVHMLGLNLVRPSFQKLGYQTALELSPVFDYGIP